MFSESKLGTSPFMKISGSALVAKRILRMKLNNWCIVLSSVSVWQSCPCGTVECVYLLWLWAHKGSKLASWTRCCSNYLPDVIFWILQGNIFFSVAAQLVQWDKSLHSHHLPVTFSVVILPGLVCKNSLHFTENVCAYWHTMAQSCSRRRACDQEPQCLDVKSGLCPEEWTPMGYNRDANPELCEGHVLNCKLSKAGAIHRQTVVETNNGETDQWRWSECVEVMKKRGTFYCDYSMVFWMRVMSKIGRWLTDVVPEKWRGTANIDHQATVLRERNRMKTTVSRVKFEKKMEAK